RRHVFLLGRAGRSVRAGADRRRHADRGLDAGVPGGVDDAAGLPPALRRDAAPAHWHAAQPDRALRTLPRRRWLGKSGGPERGTVAAALYGRAAPTRARRRSALLHERAAGPTPR